MSQQAVIHDINQIGNLMADQPEKTKDSPATVQDLRNMGIAIDANFMVIRSEAKTESALLRSEIATGFAKAESEFKSVRSEAKLESTLLRSEMATGFAKVDADFTKVRSEAKTESALLRSDMATGFADLDRRVSQLFKADIRWQAGFALTIIGAMITIAKFVI